MWNDERIAELKRQWKAGRSTTQIAAAMGVTKGVISGKLRRLDMQNLKDRVSKQDRWTPSLVNEVTRLWKAGKSTTQIAESMSAQGLTGEAVSSKLKRLGLRHIMRAPREYVWGNRPVVKRKLRFRPIGQSLSAYEFKPVTLPRVKGWCEHSLTRPWRPFPQLSH